MRTSTTPRPPGLGARRLQPLRSWLLIPMLLAFASWIAPASAEDVRIPETLVALNAPDSFELSQRHHGLAHHDIDAVVQIIEVPAPFREMNARNSDDALARRNMHVMSSEEMDVSGVSRRLVYVEQEMRGKQYGKWILMFGNDEDSVMVMGHYPLSQSGDLREAMKAAVLSARWETDMQEDSWEGLSFRITETDNLKVASRTRDGVILTTSGLTDEEIGPEKPLYLISEVATSGRRPDLEKVAKTRSKTATESNTLENISGQPLKIGGLDAYELTADVITKDGSNIGRLYRAAVSDDEMVFVLQGFVGPSNAEAYLPEFRQIAHSLKRVHAIAN